MININYSAVFVSAVISMILGSLWYGPLFGKQWMALSGIDPNTMNDPKAKAKMGKSYLIMFIGSLLMSYVLAHTIIFAPAYLNVEGVAAGLVVGFWNWIGFIAPVTLGTVLWEGKSWKLWFITNGYQLVYLLIAGVILAVWK